MTKKTYFEYSKGWRKKHRGDFCPWVDDYAKPDKTHRWCRLKDGDVWLPGMNLYRVVKAETIDAWSPPHQRATGTHGRCPVCDSYFYSAPDLHHLLVPRNYGVTLNVWWNCVPLHHGSCHERAHGSARPALLIELLEVVEENVDSDPLQYIAEQVSELQALGIVSQVFAVDWAGVA